MSGTGSDEVYCTSCGEPIKREAEACPECGVRNAATGTGTGAATETGTAPPADDSTVHCSACGAEIKAAAVICPECGVRNEARPAEETADDSDGEPSGDTEESHDPVDHETTKSGRWQYGIAIALLLWIGLLGWTMATVGPNEEVGNVVGFFTLVAWVLMPISTWFDVDYVMANTYWAPNEAVWTTLAAVPVANLVSAPVYLYRRYEAFRDAEDRRTDPGSERDPVERLQAQYARGEIDVQEFEDRVETVLEDGSERDLEVPETEYE